MSLIKRKDNRILLPIYNVFTPKECTDLIKTIENLGYTKASLYTDVDGNEHYHNDVRNSERRMIDDEDFAKLLEKRIYEYIPKEYNGMHYTSINQRFRFLKYKKGGFFARHSDGNYRTDKEISLITILIYLNDDYTGAYTTFYEDPSDNKGIELLPKVGMVALMDQDIGHAVPPLIDGIKYVVRTELMYSRYAISKNNGNENKKDGMIKIVKLG